MRKETSRKLLTTSLAFLSLFAFSCSNMINDMKAMSELKKPAEKPEEPKEFSEIWIEKIETEDYEISDSVPGKGFFLFDEESVTDENGNIHNKSWYKRNRVNIGFNPDGGFWPMKNDDGSDASADIKWDIHKYGEEIRVPDVKRTPTDNDTTEWLIFKTGYGFNGWEETVIGENTYELAPLATCPALENETELVFKAIWTANADTPYKVNYWLQEADSDSRVKYEKSDYYTGTTGELTSVTAPVIQGFEQVGSVQNEIIKGDGSTEIDIIYNRKIVKLIFKTGSENVKWADGTTDDIEISGKYGAAINKQDVKEPVHNDPNFKFAGWNKEGVEIPDTFPLDDAEFVSVWANPYKNYKVTHYFQNTSLDGYVINNELTETKTGTIGNETNANAKNITGFTAIKFDQKKLTNDQEPNDIEIYYDRATVKITLNSDTGKWKDGAQGQKEVSAVYGATISAYPELAEMEGFKFTGWKKSDGNTSQTLPDVGPAENLFFTAMWERTIANYTVRHWFQKTNLGTDPLTDYDTDESKNRYPSGTIGQNTVVTASDFTGFVTPAAENIEVKTIAADNSTVINIYYDRKPVTITMKTDGGKWNDDSTTDKTISTYYGLAVTYPAIPKKSEADKDYALTGWKVNNTETVLTTLPATADAENVTYTAQWAVSNASYEVKHYLQKTSLDGYSLDSSETFKGAVNAYTTASAKSITGFTAKAFNQEKIGASGTTIYIYYDRNPVTIIFDADGGKWNDETTEPKEINTFYGVAVTYPEDPVLEHFAFNGWDTPSLATAENDITIKAQWTQVDASYTVKHLYQNKTLDGYTLDSTETLYGTIGENTAATAKTVTGFTVQPFVNKPVTADNSTEIEIKYNRNEVTLTLKTDGGKWADDSTSDMVINTHYGVSIPAADIPAPPTREHYSFAGWNYTVDGQNYTIQDLTSQGPQASRTFTARWTQTEAPYKVRYLFEKADSAEYEQNLTDYPDAEFYGTLNEMTSVTAPDVPGFSVKSIDNKTVTKKTPVVEVKYARKEYTISFDPNGGYWKEDNKTSSVSIKQKFGTSYSAPMGTTLERLDFNFTGWKTDSGAEPNGVISAENRVYKAQWEYGGSFYKVVHKFQTLEDPTVYLESDAYPTEEKAGVLMETTAAEAKNIPGFTAKPIEQLSISAGKATSVPVLYNRNDITLTFKANGGKFGDGTLLYSKTGKYGASTAELLPANPSNEDTLKKFGGWKDSAGNTVAANALPVTFPATNETYEAVWNDIPATEINGVGTYTNKDITVTYQFSSNTLSFAVTHELSDLSLTYLEVDKASVSTSDIEVTKTPDNGKTKYTFSIPFTKGAGTYGLTLEMGNDKFTYTLPPVVMTKN